MFASLFERTLSRLGSSRTLGTPRVLLGLTAVCLTAMTGCSHYKLREVDAPMNPFGDARNGLAKVCTIKTTNVAGAVTFVSWDNGTLVGATRGPTHFCYWAEPGEHDVFVDANGTSHTHYRAEAGKSYFLHERVRFFGSPLAELVWVDAAQAEKLFPSSSYAALVDVPASETLAHGVPVARVRSHGSDTSSTR
jgi:hypothetical protein